MSPIAHCLLDSPHQRHSSLSGFARDTHIQRTDSLAFQVSSILAASCESNLWHKARGRKDWSKRDVSARSWRRKERRERKWNRRVHGRTRGAWPVYEWQYANLSNISFRSMYRNGGPLAPDFIQFPVFRPHKQALNARAKERRRKRTHRVAFPLSIELSSRGGKG